VNPESGSAAIGHHSKAKQDQNLSRDLNKSLIHPKIKMPTLKEILPRLAKAKVFSTLDAKNGFYQIGVDEQCSMKTAFWYRCYQYL